MHAHLRGAEHGAGQRHGGAPEPVLIGSGAALRRAPGRQLDPRPGGLRRCGAPCVRLSAGSEMDPIGTAVTCCRLQSRAMRGDGAAMVEQTLDSHHMLSRPDGKACEATAVQLSGTLQEAPPIRAHEAEAQPVPRGAAVGVQAAEGDGAQQVSREVRHGHRAHACASAGNDKASGLSRACEVGSEHDRSVGVRKWSAEGRGPASHSQQRT